ncbi:MAG: YceI family protein [Azospirillaceae bacterium]|nr:YceI family protein [Azospirillaceae bacterium]
MGFTGSQSGTAFSGQFSRWDAAIDFDPANPATGHATVTIDMTSATTGDVQKDQSLPQAEWFSTKAFPKAVFEATSFRAKGGNAYEAVGTLTIRSIKKDVVLPFTLDVAGGKAHAVGKLDLVRTDYGVGQGAWSTGQMVALNVGVTLDLTAATKP